MKLAKRIIGLMLAFIMTMSVYPTVARAATEDSIPSKIRLYDSMNSEAILIELADVTQTIGNIKTNNKNLVAMLTRSELSYVEGSEVASENKNTYAIGLRSKKDGSYTVSFDILDKDKKKVATKEIKVYAYDSPIKSITFNGKEMENGELSGKSAKVKVSLHSGNEIKKLEYGVYLSKKTDRGSQTELVYKTFKNGASVTFGSKAYTYTDEYSYGYEDYSTISKYFGDGMYYPTYISITYYDKYTKQNETFTEFYLKYAE